MTCLSPNAILPTAMEEGIVLEAYLDSGNVWTWAMGVTNRSGHNIMGYKDHPQALQYCVDISVWLVKTAYLPHVERAFEGHDLTESQLAAALSFHWNTGAILTTSWVRLFLQGKAAEARAFLESHYVGQGLKARRMREAALFFDGKWPSGKMLVPVYQSVAKPSYRPKDGVPTDIRAELERALA